MVAINNGFAEKHISTTWVVGKTSDDVNLEKGTAVRTDSTVNLTSLPFSSLTNDTTYYVKAKVFTNNYFSDWSNILKVTTSKKSIQKPMITLSNTTSLFPSVKISDFTPVGLTDTIKSSVLEVSLVSDFSIKETYEFSNISYKFLSPLTPGCLYYMRGKHIGIIS